MLKILLNAYACNPNWGSEQGIGWHWAIELAKYNKVVIITEGEFKENIDFALSKIPQRDNIKFVYNNVSPAVRKMCWNQGDWRFYCYYRKWQKKTLRIAKQLQKEWHFDVIHQLNMQGFREPGLLWKIKGPKFVWGPVGGMGVMPLSYIKNEPLKNKLFFRIKNTINKLQYKYQPNVREAVKKADVLLASTPDEMRVFKNIYGRDSFFVNDTGCDITDFIHEWDIKNDKPLNLIWVAKFDFRKQLELAIRTIAELKDFNIILNIVGSGNKADYYMKMASDLGVSDKCKFWGLVKHEKVLEMMMHSDVFFFTSIHEATSTVILEAIGAKLPIVCFDTCGFGPIVEEKIGRKIPISNPQKSITDFANVLTELYFHRELLPEMSKNCEERQKKLTWESKAKFVTDLYNKVLK